MAQADEGQAHAPTGGDAADAGPSTPGGANAGSEVVEPGSARDSAPPQAVRPAIVTTPPIPPAPKITEIPDGGAPPSIPSDALVLGPYSGPVSSKAARAFARGAPYFPKGGRARSARLAALIGAGLLLFAATFALTLLALRR